MLSERIFQAFESDGDWALGLMIGIDCDGGILQQRRLLPSGRMLLHASPGCGLVRDAPRWVWIGRNASAVDGHRLLVWLEQEGDGTILLADDGDGAVVLVAELHGASQAPPSPLALMDRLLLAMGARHAGMLGALTFAPAFRSEPRGQSFSHADPVSWITDNLSPDRPYSGH